MGVRHAQSIGKDQSMETGRDHGITRSDLSRYLLRSPSHVNDPDRWTASGGFGHEIRTRILIVRDHAQGVLLLHTTVQKQRSEQAWISKRDTGSV